ncbi:MAG: metal ABC transporter substrate-binding protein [Succinivibrionaceae bacterium]
MNLINKFIKATLFFIFFNAMFQSSVFAEPIKVVATVYPFYNWTQNLIKGTENHFNISLLNDKGMDIHNYQPTIKDFASITDSDITIYIGGTSDEWISDVLKNNGIKNKILIKGFSVIPDLIEEASHEDHDESHNTDLSKMQLLIQPKIHRHSQLKEYDEHIWMSLKNAKIMVKEISKALVNSTDNVQIREKINSNRKEYIKKLNKLEKKYSSFFKKLSAQNVSIILADNMPFNYLFREYNVPYVSAFENCESQNTVNFQVITRLAEAYKNSNSKAIFILKGSSFDLPNAVFNSIDTSGYIYILDSMQGNDKKYNIDSYIEVMQQNLTEMKKVLQ